MTIATAQALTILDRLQEGFQGAEGSVRVTRLDLVTLRSAITGHTTNTRDWVGRKRQDNRAVLSVGTTLLNLNPRLNHELSGWNRVALRIVDGFPILVPDPDGYTIIRNQQSAGAMLTGKLMVTLAQSKLGVGTRWLMEADFAANCWRGKQLVG